MCPGPYRFWEVHTALDEPRINQSNREFLSCYTIMKLSGLNSIISEVATKKLSFSGRLITEPKMTPLIKNLFNSRTKSFFDSDISLLYVLPSFAESLKKPDLFYYFEIWYNNSIFPTYPNWNWKNIARDNSFTLKSQSGIATVIPILKCKLLALVLQM